MSYKQPNPKQTLFEHEQEIVQFWKANKIFEKSVDMRSDKNPYLFYDGPPFITGEPHYGTLLSSIAKDVVPRYQTMKDKKVRRVWGWDCHGLPMESKVEKKLGLKGKKEIQDYGLDKFIAECFGFAKEVSGEWEWYVDSVGRWVDFKNAYKTMDRDFMESVFWAFKQIYNKGYVYEGKRVSLYSTDASSPVSNFEVAMDSLYEDVKELSTMVSFKLKDQKTDRYLVAWTTTPWTLTANMALAVKPDEKYVEFEHDGKNFIVAEKRLDYALEKSKIDKEGLKIVDTFDVGDLEGLSYEPLYNFFEVGENDYKVYLSDFVTTEDGTGVLHVAPGFGEEDFQLGQKHKLTVAMNIDDEGKMLPFVTPWPGEYLRDVSPKVSRELEERGLLFTAFYYKHSLPFYRYANPLIYKTQDAWFIDIKSNKEKLLKSNENINWVPEHIKEGRFHKGIETAPDWCISRNRFWGTPMPVWKGIDDAGNQIVKVIGSLDELRESSIDPITKITFMTTEKDGALNYEKEGGITELLKNHSGKDIKVFIDAKDLLPLVEEYERAASHEQAEAKLKNYTNGKPHYYIFDKPLELHRPDVDVIQLLDKETNTVLNRISEVFDCWVESGSMPFAQMHYPFENQNTFEKSYPADYVVEYVGQTRAWFYVMHVMGNLLKDSFEDLGMKDLEGNPFKNIICTGVLAGNDGKKMSKSLGNYSNPKATIEKFGGEAVRYWLMASPLMSGGGANADDKEMENAVKIVLNPYWNVYKYFLIYAEQHNWDYSQHVVGKDVMDHWIRARMQKFVNDYDKGMSEYNIPAAMREIQPMLEEISTWFIRRSRQRFADGSVEAISTLYDVLMTFSKVVASIFPFTAEEIYLNLKNDGEVLESIHLHLYPEVRKLNKTEQELLDNMAKVRELATAGLEIRDKEKIKLRQPLSEFTVNVDLPENLRQILAEEMNVEKVTVDEKVEGVNLDTNISEDLKLKGSFREVVRAVQDMRKKSGMKAGETIMLSWNTDGELKEVFEKMTEELKKAVIAQEVNFEMELEQKLTLNGEKIGLAVSKE